METVKNMCHMEYDSAEPACGHPLRRRLIRGILRFATLAYPAVLRMAALIGKWQGHHITAGPQRILLTGKFFSDNWINAHIRPLAASQMCKEVRLVSTYPIAPGPKVTVVYPPRWMRRLAGEIGARMVTFTYLAMRWRPDIVGGFHLLVNGLVAGILARLAGARSLYFCVGGPMEVLGGGVWAENRVFGLLERPDPVVERGLIRAVGELDLVVAMGTGAVAFFRERGIDTQFHVISGGIDTRRFAHRDAPRSLDLLLVGRLAPVKRVDRFLRAVALVAEKLPEVRAAVVGDGPLRESLIGMSRELGIADRVTFAGHRSDVEEWLRRARVFVLTSDSEGLALSVMEALACGLPAIVSNVGDLGDLIQSGVNGYLIDHGTPAAFAERAVELLTDEPRWTAMSQDARRSTSRYEFAAVARQWDEALNGNTSVAAVHSSYRGSRE